MKKTKVKDLSEARTIIEYVNMKTPNVGDIVNYKARGSADGKFPKVDRAAIITDARVDTASDDYGVLMYQCRVAVFNPEGLFFSDWLKQGQEGGDWDWPKK